MKKILIAIAALGLFSTQVMAQTDYTINTEKMSPYDQNKPIGWATVDGTITGGGTDGDIVTVTSRAQLQTALIGTTKKIIYIDGNITFSGNVSITNAHNKTIIGLPGSSFENTTHSDDKSKSGILSFSGCKNIIMRNLTFKGAGAYDIDGNDNLTLSNCQYIWVDHCDFQDGVDGNFDCNNGSNNICVSWCRFRYLKAPYGGGSGGSDDHRFSNLWGGGDENGAIDEGKLNTTFVCCWWDNGCVQRMPRVRFGKVHLLNCLYSSTNASACVAAGHRSNLYVENCAFTSSAAKNNAWKCYATKEGFTDYNITLTGNSGANNDQKKSGSIDYFIPTNVYEYTAFDASLVENTVSNLSNGAGATLKFGDGDDPDPEGNLGTINWPMSSNTNATISEGITNAIASTSVTPGSNLVLRTNGTYGNVRFSLYQAQSIQDNASADNAVTFAITMNSGYSFKASSIQLLACRVGTDSGVMDISWNDNGSVTPILTGQIPSRNRKDDTGNNYFTTYNIPVLDLSKETTGTCSLIVNIYKLGATDKTTGALQMKDMGLADIIIKGYVTETSTGITTPVTLTTATGIEFYNTAGQRVSSNTKGLIIEKQRLENGQVVTRKVMK